MIGLVDHLDTKMILARISNIYVKKTQKHPKRQKVTSYSSRIWRTRLWDRTVGVEVSGTTVMAWQRSSRTEGQGDALGGRDGQNWNRTKPIMFGLEGQKKKGKGNKKVAKPVGSEQM